MLASSPFFIGVLMSADRREKEEETGGKNSCCFSVSPRTGRERERNKGKLMRDVPAGIDLPQQDEARRSFHLSSLVASL